MVVSYIFGGLAIVAVVISIIFRESFASCSELLSSISTIISIALGVVSIAYTYYSSVKTEKKLNSIKSNNDSLVSKINLELGKENYNKKNIESILKD